VHFARNLIKETDLPITKLAGYARFGSIRQFNHAMRRTAGGSRAKIPEALERWPLWRAYAAM